MDTVLLSVTILSLAIAVALAVIVAKLIREERARSDARVTALTAMAAQAAAEAPLAAASLAPLTAAPAAAPVVPVAVPRGRIASTPVPVPQLDDFDIRPETASVAGVSHLFEEAPAESPWGRRLAVIGGIAAVLAAIAFAFTSSHPRADAVPTAAAAAPQRPDVVDGAPLELVSLRHTQEAQRLVITGLVQNPRGGAPMSRVVATAFLFGPDGAFLTSSRAPLDFTTLSPGDESPFVVNVAVTGPVARYRIGFRTDDGRVIEHVDKRAPEAMAQK